MVFKVLRSFLWTVLFSAVIALGSMAHAQSAPEGAQPPRLNPQQRAQVKEKLRSRWQAMSPQERGAAKLKLKQRFQSLSPEQKEKLLQRWQQRRDSAPDQ